MNKKVIVITIVLIVVVGAISGLFLLTRTREISSPLPLKEQQPSSVEKLPSTTLKEYTDPSGFILNYPDNLSLAANEATDSATYADLLFSAKEVGGSLSLKITDSKLKSFSDWFKEHKDASASGRVTETQLGTLKASEIKSKEKVVLIALDQGVLFTIEVFFDGQEAFWMSMYDTMRSSFSFAPPEQPKGTSQGGGVVGDEVIFEGEEIVE